MTLTRSRRLLIATLVVVGLVGGLWWWSRPNLDPRFVGRWDVHPSLREILVIDSDGSAQALWRDDLSLIERLSWCLNGDRQFVLASLHTPGDGLRDVLARIHSKFSGARYVAAATVWNVRELSADRISLELSDHREQRLFLQRESPAAPSH
jgi:hypothetical protein